MSLDRGSHRQAGATQEQARHWERKLDLLLRLEAEALLERLGIRSAEPHEPGTAHGGVVEK